MPYKDKQKQKEFGCLWKRNKNIENRKKVLDSLGGKCNHCGIEDYRVLEIDHIEPLLRKWINGRPISGTRLIADIIYSRVELNTIQLLCANCHRIKTIEDRKKFNNYLGDL